MTTRAFLIGLLCGVSQAPAAGQMVLGRVTSEAGGVPLAGVPVSLLRGAHNTVRGGLTDAEGRYLLEAPAAGEYRVVADQLGYRRLESPLLAIGMDRTVTIDFELPIDPVELEGIEVEVQRRRELEARVEQYGVSPKLLGSRFVPRSEMQKRPNALNVGEVLQWQNLAGIRVGWSNNPPSLCVQVARARNGCALTVLDGVLVDDEFAASIPAAALEAAVILRPAEATLSYGTIGSSGAVLLFTRGTVAR